MKHFARVAIAAAVAIASAAVHAAPVSYSEFIDGDLPPFGALPVLALDVGTNTVSGRFGSNSNGTHDADNFAFTVAAGFELAGIQVDLTDAIGNIVATTWALREGTSWNAGTTLAIVNSLSPGSYSFGGPPLQAGSYNFTHLSYSAAGSPNQADYAFRLTVRATNEIPEPGSLALIGAALLAGSSAGVRRRRQPA